MDDSRSSEPRVARPRASEYDAVAETYARFWGGDAPRMAAIASTLLLERLGPGARVLDAACGPGHLTPFLLERDLRVVGVDSSERMVALAKERVPEADFICEDLRDLDWPARFDAAACMFDSLNHLLTMAELTAVLRNIRRALKPGAWLLFDVNTEEGFRERWRGSFSHVGDDEVWIARPGYDPSTSLGTFRITLFGALHSRRSSAVQWRRTDVTLTERCYSLPEIRDALGEAGLEIDREEDAARLGWDHEVGRRFFLTRRPEAAP